jgi:hypothetical protein
MMPTATLEREELLQIVRDLPAEKLVDVLKFTKNILDEEEGGEPNEKTAAALRESADMKNLIGPFHSVDALMASLMADGDAWLSLLASSRSI